jgi:hypothetical protein
MVVDLESQISLFHLSMTHQGYPLSVKRNNFRKKRLLVNVVTESRARVRCETKPISMGKGGMCIHFCRPVVPAGPAGPMGRRADEMW